jgi:hypothetical protein
MKQFLVFTSLLLINFSGMSQKWNFENGKQKLTLELNHNSLYYQLNYNQQSTISPSLFSFIIKKPQSIRLNEFTLLSIDSSNFNETWAPVWGEEDSIQNNYKKVVCHLSEINSHINIDIEFRIFKDGIGFRYHFPKQENLNHFVLEEESTQFSIKDNPTAYWIPGDYDTNEYTWNISKLSEIDAYKEAEKEKDIAVTSLISKTSVQTPLLLKTSDNLFISIHEAALLNYPAMNLQWQNSTEQFTTQLVPDAVGNKAYISTPFSTPWRTIIVSDKAADLLTSRTIMNLNEPTAIQNTSWIHPQKYMGVWWEMHIGKANWFKEGNKHGANTENVKKYIDFASKHHFDGLLVEGWNKGWEDWFGNWKENVFDFVTPYEDYNMKEITAYAKSKNIKMIMHHETSGAVTTYDRLMDTAFRYMKANDIQTVKTGYVGKIIPRGEHHDGQWMVNHFTRVAQKTADYQIMLAAHEPVHPTGLHRTYPNWMANEAARGTEFNNAPTLGIQPNHQTIIPFTRLMGGPMDYTPGIFHFQLNQFDADRKQRVTTTLAKQLALYITMYSPIQMASDLPENYEKHLDAFKFIEEVPVNWSETKILEANPGEYITIARREKNKPNWFVGSITNENARVFECKFDFLDKNKTYQLTIYKDGNDADYLKNPESYLIEKLTITNKSIIKIPIAKGGGCAMSIQLK